MGTCSNKMAIPHVKRGSTWNGIDTANMILYELLDLILSKLAWARDSHSESQFRDVSMMLASVPELDFAYIEKWAAQLGVLSKLDELRP